MTSSRSVHPSRRSILKAGGALAIAGLTGEAKAAGYPERPI
jgi:hypothetical protein